MLLQHNSLIFIDFFKGFRGSSGNPGRLTVGDLHRGFGS